MQQQSNIVPINELPPDMFKLSLTRIVASILCLLRLHQPYVFVDTTNKETFWLCIFCGHKSEPLKNVELVQLSKLR